MQSITLPGHKMRQISSTRKYMKESNRRVCVSAFRTDAFIEKQLQVKTTGRIDKADQRTVGGAVG